MFMALSHAFLGHPAAAVVCLQMVHVNVDASNLPRRYTRVVYDQCFGFPRILVFFLLGTFQVRQLWCRFSEVPLQRSIIGGGLSESLGVCGRRRGMEHVMLREGYSSGAG